MTPDPSVAVPSPCSHGMPTPGSCVDCMDAGPIAPPARWVRVGGVFGASYPGTCWCGDEVVMGDLVERWDRDTHTIYAHLDCGKPSS